MRIASRVGDYSSGARKSIALVRALRWLAGLYGWRRSTESPSKNGTQYLNSKKAVVESVADNRRLTKLSILTTNILMDPPAGLEGSSVHIVILDWSDGSKAASVHNSLPIILESHQLQPLLDEKLSHQEDQERNGNRGSVSDNGRSHYVELSSSNWNRWVRVPFSDIEVYIDAAAPAGTIRVRRSNEDSSREG